MAYNKTNWIDNETDVNAKNLNNLEEGVKTLDVELVELKNDVAGKAADNHTHAELEALQNAVNEKAPSNHKHTDLEDRIKAVEDRPAGETVDLKPLTDRVVAVEEAIPGLALKDHTHEGMGEVDLKPLTDRVVALEAAVSDILARLVIVENAMTAGGEGHIHEELEAKVTALEAGKAEMVHTHNSSDIITNRAVK